MKKAIIVTWDGFQDQEVIYPYYRLQEDGFDVEIASGNIGNVIGLFGTKFESKVLIKHLNYNNYDFLVLPGGVKALEKLRQEENIKIFIKNYFNEGKIIASICHGAQLLISAKVTQGLKISGYYSIKDDIVNSGAEYIDQPSVVSKNIISSPHYKYMGEWMKVALQQYNYKYGI